MKSLVLISILCMMMAINAHPTKPVDQERLRSFFAPNALDDSLECQMCDTFIQILQTNGNNHTEWIPLIEKTCSALPKSFQHICNVTLANIESVVAGLISAQWPGVICGELMLCLYDCCLTDLQPEQVHLSFTENQQGILVQWSTLKNSTSIVQWGTTSQQYNQKTTGYTLTYTNGGWVGILHRVTVNPPQPDTKYYYRVGDGTNWSQEFSFWSAPGAKINRPFNFLMIGDMGLVNSNQTVSRLTNEVATNHYDCMIFNGDLDYGDGFSPVSDGFYREIESWAAYLPTYVSVGNHDTYINSAAILYRNQMPSVNWTTNSLYYSFDYVNANVSIHFISLATDTPPFDVPDLFPGSPQYKWFENDLKIAASKNYDWIIVFQHRPLYCSNIGDDLFDCFQMAPMFRNWLEDLAYNYRVDLYLEAHEHSYERTYPVYKSKTQSTSYHNPNATVYIMNGAAGNDEYLDYDWADVEWRASKASVYGYARFSVTKNELHWQFIQDTDGTVIDDFSITKD